MTRALLAVARRLADLSALAGLVILVAVTVEAGPVGAQTPTPRVAITGLVDQVTSVTRNLSLEDLSYQRDTDREWYARTRLRPDLVAEVGTTRAVLGLEIDMVWGQTGPTDTGPTGQRFGASGGWDLNTDSRTVVEIKWGYVEFEAPLVPWKTRVRLGAQPFAATYKHAVLAEGDFAGASVDIDLTSWLTGHFIYAQTGEVVTGHHDGFPIGDSYAYVFSAEIVPVKGVELRPTFGKAYLEGNVSSASRQGRGGVSVTGFGQRDLDKRYAIGLDARLRRGPFFLDPTVLYQFGYRYQTFPDDEREAVRSAWFVDVRGGYRAGPLLLEAAGIYTTGNKAQDDLTNGRTPIKFYEPIDTDTAYYAGWAEIWALGIDYFNILYARAPGLNPGLAIGYDKYGMIRVGFRPSYALTPDLVLHAAATASWSAEAVDTDGTLAPATGITPVARPGEARPRGDERYLGTELDLGLSWRFAPNLTFDLVGAYLWSGPALATATTASNQPSALPAVLPNRHPRDVQAVSARIRFTF